MKGAGQARSSERPVASVAELTAPVEATPERYQLALLLAAWCQLRRGDVLGLQRRDVDLLHGSIRVERALVRPMKGDAVMGPPKTAAGVRSLAVPSHVVAALEEHLAELVGPDPAAWLFTGELGGPMTPSTLDRVWQRARKSIGRTDLCLHDLRHSGLTWSAASGASVAELMGRGGHAHPAAALRYQHATEDRDRRLLRHSPGWLRGRSGRCARGPTEGSRLGAQFINQAWAEKLLRTAVQRACSLAGSAQSSSEAEPPWPLLSYRTTPLVV